MNIPINFSLYSQLHIYSSRALAVTLLMLLLGLSLSLVSPNAQAGTFYKCTDSSGRTSFTTNPNNGKNCEQQYSSQQTQATTNNNTTNQAKQKTTTTTNQATPRLPKVSIKTQKVRDKDRAKLLLDELNFENQIVQLTSERLNQTEKPQNIEYLKNRIKQHQANIQAITRELERLDY